MIIQLTYKHNKCGKLRLVLFFVHVVYERQCVSWTPNLRCLRSNQYRTLLFRYKLVHTRHKYGTYFTQPSSCWRMTAWRGATMSKWMCALLRMTAWRGATTSKWMCALLRMTPWRGATTSKWMCALLRMTAWRGATTSKWMCALLCMTPWRGATTSK